jgi:hypothetical protein
MRSTGFSAFMALWKTIAISRQRSFRSSAALADRTSTPSLATLLPLYVTLPPVITAGARSSRTAP